MYKKIVVPLDGSKLAECVFPHVKAMIKACDGSPEVLFVQAVEPLAIPYGRGGTMVTSIEQLKAFEAHNQADAEKYLAKTVARFKKDGINARAEVIYGRAAEALSDFIARNNIDLVIIATHGRSGVSRWVWGSVTDRLLRSICVPVFIVRAPGCVPGI
jgi:nucleotide-binding universal stress UspA family protein